MGAPPRQSQAVDGGGLRADSDRLRAVFYQLPAASFRLTRISAMVVSLLRSFIPRWPLALAAVVLFAGGCAADEPGRHGTSTAWRWACPMAAATCRWRKRCCWKAA